jgi:site-specific DNA recombinase
LPLRATHVRQPTPPRRLLQLLAQKQQPRAPRQIRRPPTAVYLREDAVLDAVARFFADRVFGRQRRAILTTDLATIDNQQAHARDADRQRLHRRLADIARRQNSILRQAQDGDPDDPFTRALRSTYNDLDAERLTTLSALATLDATDPTAPARPDAAEVDLLDALPHLTANLVAAPEALLRRLFEATNLTERLCDSGNHVAISIRLPADTMPKIVGTVEAIRQTINKPTTAPSQAMTGACVDAVRAPGRIRTCAPAS